jgi:hypothetical protein
MTIKDQIRAAELTVLKNCAFATVAIGALGALMWALS